MKKTTLFLTSFLLLVSIASADGSTVFSTEFSIYQNDSIELNDFEIAEGTPTREAPGDGTHIAELKDINNEVMYEKELLVAMTPVAHGEHNHSEIEPSEQREIQLRLPYMYEATSIDIYQIDGNSSITVDIPNKICIDDGSCHFYCEGRGLDPDCETEEHQQTSETTVIDRITSTLRALIRPLT